ncbi:MAG: hypothetical protein MZV70_41420 [Desulfobacterales bacterium]|nr:hypothetical protein [Desulfobacterales bacterium]
MSKDHEVFHLALNWGYFEVVNDTVTILVETAERADEIDLETGTATLGRAEEALKGSLRRKTRI